jgi:hypothetical protein
MGFMKSAVVEDEQVEGIQECLGKVSEPEWKALGIASREFQKEAGPSSRFDGPIERKIVERVRDRGKGLHAAGGDAPPQPRQ